MDRSSNDILGYVRGLQLRMQCGNVTLSLNVSQCRSAEVVLGRGLLSRMSLAITSLGILTRMKPY